jgi:hypothetical protein
VYDAARDPDLLVMTYEYLSEEDPAVVPDKNNVHDFLKKLAERRAGGAGNVERTASAKPA